MDYGSFVANRSTTVIQSEDCVTTACDEQTDGESPLALTRGSETKPNADTTGQDNSPDAYNSPQVNLLSPRYHSSSLTTDDIGQGTSKHHSFHTEKTYDVSVLEPSTGGTERETQKSGKPVVENVAKTPPVDRGGTRTDQDVYVEPKEVLSMTVAFDLGVTSERLALLHSGGKVLIEKKEDGDSGDGKRFRAKINLASNSQAEEELRKQIRYC